MDDHLEWLAYNGAANEVQHSLLKLASRLRQCEYPYRNESPPDSKARHALRCKSWLCPRCQHIRAVRLRNNIVTFFKVNEIALRGQRIYFLTLTVPHAHELGKDTSGCVRQLLEAFSETRGSNGDRRQQKWWNNHITGGIYAVEILPPAANRKDFLDTSLHVHIHCLLLAEQDLSRDVGSSHSSFTQQLRDEWARRTGANERGVCLEPIYWKEGKIKHEYVHGLGHGSAQFIRAVNGAVGYITKGTAPELFQTLTARELYAVHVTHKRTYGRFGVLYGRNAHQQFTHTELLEVDPKPKRAKHQLSEPNYTAPSTSSAKPELNVPVVAQFESCACQHIHVDKPLGDQCLSNALEPSSSPVIWTDADWDSVFG